MATAVTSHIELALPHMYDDERDVMIASVKALPANAHLVEFGGGGSTICWASMLHDDQHLTTVEHAENWTAAIAEELLKRDLHGISLVCVPLDAAYGKPEEETVLPDSENYLHPPVEWDKVKWVLVDGIMRAATLISLFPKLQPGTDVYVHDYVGREPWYDLGAQLYQPKSITHTLLHLVR